MLQKFCVLLLLLCVYSTGKISAQEREYLPPSHSLARLFRPRHPEHINLRTQNTFRNTEKLKDSLVPVNNIGKNNESRKNPDIKHFSPPIITEKASQLLHKHSDGAKEIELKAKLHKTSILNLKLQRTLKRAQYNICQPRGKLSGTSQRGANIIGRGPQIPIISTPQFPLPQPRPSHDPDNGIVKGTLPPDVCDRCPVSPSGESLLEPCNCVGNTDSGAGLISITCPETIRTIEQLKEILTTPDYYTTHVSRFTMENTNVTGTVSPSLWGNLDFKQVLLDNNKLDYIDNKAFANSADYLHYLSLRNNNIKQYVTGQDNELPYLETLLLSNNEIPIIFSGAFTYRNLKILDLSHNLITSVGEFSFADLDNIVELNLSHNMLTTLEDYDFKFNNHAPPAQLIQIILSDNDISFISDKAFADLYFVQIELQNNQLTTLSEAVFKHILVASSNFAYIMVTGNPIVCDCDILWMVEDAAMKACFDNFICANTGMNIAMVTPDTLGNCTVSTT